MHHRAALDRLAVGGTLDGSAGLVSRQHGPEAVHKLIVNLRVKAGSVALQNLLGLGRVAVQERLDLRHRTLGAGLPLRISEGDGVVPVGELRLLHASLHEIGEPVLPLFRVAWIGRDLLAGEVGGGVLDAHAPDLGLLLGVVANLVRPARAHAARLLVELRAVPRGSVRLARGRGNRLVDLRLDFGPGVQRVLAAHAEITEIRLRLPVRPENRLAAGVALDPIRIAAADDVRGAMTLLTWSSTAAWSWNFTACSTPAPSCWTPWPTAAPN